MVVHCIQKLYIVHYLDETEYVYEGQLRLVRNPPLRNGPILRNISLSEGLLQVYLKGNWTFVCSQTFSDNEAETACRQLGYTTFRYHTAQSPNYNSNW